MMHLGFPTKLVLPIYLSIFSVCLQDKNSKRNEKRNNLDLDYTTLNKATLRLYGSANDSDGQVVAMVHSVNGTFNESSITWQNAPPVWLSASRKCTKIKVIHIDVHYLLSL